MCQFPTQTWRRGLQDRVFVDPKYDNPTTVVHCIQLSCWRAHPCGISSVRCAAVSGMQGQDLLLIASQDCTVSLWSLQGGLVGVMGKHTWTLSDPSTWQDPKASTLSCMHSQSLRQTQTCPSAQACIFVINMLISICFSTYPCGLALACVSVDLHMSPWTCMCLFGLALEGAFRQFRMLSVWLLQH